MCILSGLVMQYVHLCPLKSCKKRHLCVYTCWCLFVGFLKTGKNILSTLALKKATDQEH